ncbi:LPXTG cell wall anchor domain-containing protein [Lentilactobacillus sunkii]|uniref:LPXTG-motif cell wall anchor domain-containing protein n=1 Tax=Lentilactobacillus sunkii DSM 19904 TaxID=1423808 RepID=A0A0R1L7G0_9LACO|nr:LPXTG cell wall anchor domain-containing protein [Lentilactobacillus sunkii]KRK88817.1 LPXTG-motif cell wall anchor domain-containing protein [Lentilactobacillus sunkii DSM 19904]
MKKRTSFWIQAIGVLTLVLGNFFTAGTALADVISTKEVVADNAKLIDDRRGLITKSKVGDQANMAFDLTVGGLSQSGTVKFNYNADYFKIKDKQFKFSNGDTKVVVDIDGKESTISWTNAIDKTDLEVILPVKFNRTVNDRELDFVVDDEKVKLPTLTVVEEDEDVKDVPTVEKPDGNLADDNILNEALADEKASDEAEAAHKEAESKNQPKLTEDTQKDAEVDENSSQADAVEQPKQSNREQAEALLKEKQAADQKKAEEKSRQAIADTQKSDKQAQSTQSTDVQTVKDGGETKESATPQTPEVSDLKGAKEAVAADDADADEPADNQITRQLPVNGVFDDEDGNDITQQIKAAETPQFFKSISFTYKDKDGKMQTKQIPPVLEEIVELPSVLRVNKNIEIQYEWDIDTIKEKTGIDIQQGDFYTFDLKGMTYKYGTTGLYDEFIKYNGKTIGRFTMTPTADPHTQNVKITFLPGELEGVSNIQYKASLKTEINANSDEISFGENSKGEIDIEVGEELVSVEKVGAFHKENGVTDLDTLDWTSTFKVKDGKKATNVELYDRFGTGFEHDKNKVDYVFTIQTADGKETVIDDKSSAEYKRIVANNQIFKFDVDDLNLPDGITEIEVNMVTPVVRTDYKSFKNEIKANNVTLSDGEKTKTLYTEAWINRDKNHLTKTAKMDENGKIKYTVGFTVEAGQKNITLKDTLSTNRFSFSSDKNDYTLSPAVEGWFAEGPTVDGKTLSIKFSDAIVPETGMKTYTFSYIINPADDITDADYKDITNSVEVNGQKKSHQFGPTINSKNNVSFDWQKMMTSWSIHVNQIERNIDGTFTITEPVKGTNPNYLDYQAYYDSFSDGKDGFTDEIKNHLSFTKKTNDSKWDYKVVNGKAYWADDTDNENEAFTVSASDGQIKIQVLNLPAGEKSFVAYLNNVPLDKDKILKATPAELALICNYAGVDYEGSGETVVSTCKGQGDLIRNNISKEGQLSKNFLKDGIINWTTRFNYRQYLGSDEEKLMTKDGIDITDEVGPDVIKDASGATTDRDLQDIKNLLMESLQVSLAKIDADGRGISESQILDKKQYIVEVDVDQNHKVTFNLKLSDDAYEDVYQGGKKVIELKYQSKVANFKADDEKAYEHLKSWTFRNQATVQWNKDDEGEYAHTLQANAAVSYTDNGHLLNKEGVLQKDNLELNEGDHTRKVGAVKWNLAINGNGYKLKAPVKITDTLGGGHYHLKTNDNNYKLKIYEAKRSLSNDNVVYSKDSDSPLTEGQDYEIVYSDSLNTMTIKFNSSYTVDTPLLVEYYTVTSKTIGTSYSNEVKLTISSKDFEDTEEVESSATVAGQYTTFAANIKKVDAATQLPLEGVKFQTQMKNKSGNWTAVGEEKLTDKQGFVSFDGLYDKPTYRIVEISGLENYDDRWVSDEFTIADAQKESEDGNENTYCITAENHRTNALKIKKTVTNPMSVNKDDQFEFKVYVTDKDGEVNTDFNDEFSYAVGAENGVVRFEKGKSTNLPAIKDGQVITITGLPQDKYYRVVESANGSYKATHTIDNLTTVEPDGNGGDQTDVFQMLQGKDAAAGIVKFNNEGQTTHFGFSKKIEGPNTDDDKNQTFDFMMKVMDESGNVDTGFSGEIEGIKHTTNGDANVTFNFDRGVAKEVEYSDKSKSSIELKTGESYRNIKLPANVKVKVYEKQDTQYTEVHYRIDDGEENEAGDSDEKGWNAVGPVNANNSTVKFINKQVVNQFEFEKVVAGDMPEGVQGFDFKVEADDEETVKAVKGQTVKAIVKNATTNRVINSGEIKFDDDGSATQIKYGTDELTDPVNITLEDNQKLVILGLPKDATKFKVTETTNGHFDTNTHVDGEKKQIDSKEAVLELNRENAENSIQFENVAPDLVPFTVRKTVTSSVVPADKNKTFEFVLTIMNPATNWNDDKPVEFRADNSAGKVTFHKDGDVYKSEKLELKANESITLYISKGLQIDAQETNTEGYKVSHQFGEHKEDGDSHQITTDKDMPELIFNNHSLTTGIEVKKTVKAEDKNQLGQEDYSKKFKFKVHGTDKEGESLPGTFTLRKYSVSGQYKDEDVSFNQNDMINFNLKHDQKAQILGLPIGSKIQVTETEESSEGYDPSYKVNDNSEKQGNKATEFITQEDQLGTVHFINTKVIPEEASLMVKKVLAGPVTDEDKDVKFEFRVTATPKDGVADELSGKFKAEKLDHNGDTSDVDVEFTDGKSDILKLQGGESINIKGLPTDYKYSVSERTRAQRFMYETSYNVNDTTDKNGSITEGIALKDGQAGKVVFTNTKFEVENAELSISKKLAGGGIIDADKNKSFTFVIETDASVDGEYDAVLDGHDKVKVTFNNGKATVDLRADEKIVIKDLPSEHNTYTVTETNGSSFKTKYQLNGTRMEDGTKTKVFKLTDKQRIDVDFTNSKDTPKLASLKVNKEIAGEGLTTADHDRDFNFRIYSEITGEFKAVKMDQHGDSHDLNVKFANGESDVITLKDGESLTINGLPIDYTYSVGEEQVNGFAPTYKVNGAKVQSGMTTQSFKLTEDQKGTVEFTNTKNGEMELGILSVSKFVNELGDRSRKFEFHIEVTDGLSNPLNGAYKTQVTTDGKSVDGTIQLNGGNGKFTLTHGQTIKFFLPLGAKYEIAEQDYSKDGYVTTVTKRNAVVNDPTVTGTATKEDDTIVYHNDLEDDEAELPLPGDEDEADDSSIGTLDSDDSAGTSGNTSSVDSPMGIPSSGYTGKSTLPQTGEDNNTLLMVIGMFMLVVVLGMGSLYLAKRKS